MTPIPDTPMPPADQHVVEADQGWNEPTERPGGAETTARDVVGVPQVTGRREVSERDVTGAGVEVAGDDRSGHRLGRPRR